MKYTCISFCCYVIIVFGLQRKKTQQEQEKKERKMAWRNGNSGLSALTSVNHVFRITDKASYQMHKHTPNTHTCGCKKKEQKTHQDNDPTLPCTLSRLELFEQHLMWACQILYNSKSTR